MRVIKMLALSAVMALTTLSLSAQASVQEGVDYAVINPAVPTSTPGKVEVTEVFWFGCPHCYHFEPLWNNWVKTAPKTAAVLIVPAALARNWEPGAKLYYALDALGVEKRLHNDIFTAIHVISTLLPNDESAFPDWVAGKGVDKKKFIDSYKSFAVQSKMAASKQKVLAWGIDGTPGVVVNGKYRLIQPAGMNQAKLNEVLNFLVAKAAKENKIK